MMRILLLASFLLGLGLAPAHAADRYFQTSDGVRLHYTDTGRGHAIVLVPGWAMPGWIFAPQVAAFSRRYRVIVLDPRGQGASDIPSHGYDQSRRGEDIANLIAHLHAGPVVIVGWSLGVLDTLAYVHAHGDGALAGLVLIDNSVGENPPPVPRYHPPGPERPWAGQVRAFVGGMFATHQSAAYLNRLTAAALRLPRPYAERLRAYPVPRSYWREAVLSVRRPILYVVRPHLSGQAASLEADNPEAASVVLAGVGHALFVDRPAAFNALLSGFLQKKLGW